MLALKYLANISYETFPNIPEVYALKHPNKKGSWYYISTYNYFAYHKKNFFDMLRSLGQEEVNEEWEMHHVVEKQHLRKFYEEEEVDPLYKYTWPCILIHESEHKAYNSVLHCGATSIIFPMTGNDKKSNIQNLYREVYEGNRVLQQIAENVIQEL